MVTLSTFWLIPFYPLIGAFLIGVLRRGAALIAPVAVGLSFLHALAAWMSPREGAVVHRVGQWLPGISFGFQFDDLSAQMALVVSGIGLLIHLYSLGYMGGHENFTRYFGGLNLFLFFMLLLVLANNLALLFAGWEGVGLASYLLIGFQFEKRAANEAANKAFLYNRAGDAGFLVALCILLATVGSVEFGALNGMVASPELTAAGLLLAFGAAGKSAQAPLFVWLPDAMVGPTPVSALIHAATMVTAGVYLFARLAPMYALLPEVGLTIAVVGLFTSYLAATVALVENDIKRILAYSTISQLGLMFFACGIGAPQAAMFHVTTHAFFKALLFLCAGNVIHALKGEQDIRYMGGLRASMPWTFRLMSLGALALAGLPPLAGFFSKDAILLAAADSPLLLGIAMGIPLLTSLYASRMMWTVFFGAEQQAGHDPKGWELHTLWPLALGTVTAGWFGAHAEGPLWIPMATGLLTVAGLWWGREIRVFEPLQTLFRRKWFVDDIYRHIWLHGVGGQGARGLNWFDRNVVDLLPRGAGWTTSGISALVGWWDRNVVDGLVQMAAFLTEAASYPVRLAQTGGLAQYALVILAALAGFLALTWFRLGGAQ